MDDDSTPLSDHSDVATNKMTDTAVIRDRPVGDVLQLMMTQSGGELPDQTGYDPRSETYHAQHNWTDSQPLSTTVMEVVGAATNTEADQMDPLYDALDPDALDAIFRPRFDDVPRTNGQVMFSLDGHDVAVHSYGYIVVDVSKKERGGNPSVE